MKMQKPKFCIKKTTLFFFSKTPTQQTETQLFTKNFVVSLIFILTIRLICVNL